MDMIGKKRYIESHGITTKWIGGTRLEACEVLVNRDKSVVERWADVTDWTWTQIREWLGY